MTLEDDLEVVTEGKSGWEESAIRLAMVPLDTLPRILSKIEAKQGNPSLWSSLSFEFIRHRHLRDAEGIFRKLLEKDFGSPSANLNNIGVALFYQARLEEAAELFAEAYAMDLKGRGNHAEARTLPAWKNLLATENALREGEPKNP